MINLAAIPFFGVIKWGAIALVASTLLYFAWDVVDTYQERARLEQQVSQLSKVITDKNERISFLERDIQRRERILKEANERELELEREMREILENLPEDAKEEAPESIKELIKKLRENDEKEQN